MNSCNQFFYCLNNRNFSKLYFIVTLYNPYPERVQNKSKKYTSKIDDIRVCCGLKKWT